MRSKWVRNAIACSAPAIVFGCMVFVGGAECAGAGGLPCPELCTIVVDFSQSKDRVTIAPQGGESLADAGISIDLMLRSCDDRGIAGIPRQEIVLYNPALCLCPGGAIADVPTDLEGRTRFTGTIRGGGCVESLSIYFSGFFIGTVPVKTNSPDTGGAGFMCTVDASDLSEFATHLGIPAAYSICFDFNESGPPTIEAGDLSMFASVLGSTCP